MKLSRDALMRVYRQMATIRQFEERLHEEMEALANLIEAPDQL